MKCSMEIKGYFNRIIYKCKSLMNKIDRILYEELCLNLF